MRTTPLTQKQVVGTPSLLLRLSAGVLSVGLLALLTGAGFAEVDTVVEAPGRVISPAGPIPVRPPEQPAVGLRVLKVLVEDGQAIQEGTDLFILDTKELEVSEEAKSEKITTWEVDEGKLEAAIAKLPAEQAKERKVAEAETADAKKKLAEEKRKWDLYADSINTRVTRARADVEVYRKLYRDMAIPRMKLEEAEEDLKRLLNLLEIAKKEMNPEPIKTREIGLEMLAQKHKNEMEKRKLELEKKAFDIQQAKKERAEIRRLKDLGTVKAPVAGLVSRCNIKEGMVLDRGHPALYLLEFSQTFEMLVTRRERDQLALDMPAKVQLDETPRRRLEGRIAFIGSDPVGDGPRPLYPVRIKLQNDPNTQQPTSLRSGLPGSGAVVLTQQRLLSVLCGGTRNRLHLSESEQVVKK